MKSSTLTSAPESKQEFIFLLCRSHYYFTLEEVRNLNSLALSIILEYIKASRKDHTWNSLKKIQETAVGWTSISCCRDLFVKVRDSKTLEELTKDDIISIHPAYYDYGKEAGLSFTSSDPKEKEDAVTMEFNKGYQFTLPKEIPVGSRVFYAIQSSSVIKQNDLLRVNCLNPLIQSINENKIEPFLNYDSAVTMQRHKEQLGKPGCIIEADYYHTLSIDNIATIYMTSEPLKNISYYKDKVFKDKIAVRNPFYNPESPAQLIECKAAFISGLNKTIKSDPRPLESLAQDSLFNKTLITEIFSFFSPLEKKLTPGTSTSSEKNLAP